MKLIYVSNSVFPSNAASGVHVMKMCEAFALQGFQVELIGLKGDNSNLDLHAHYGVSNSFKIRLLTHKILPARLYIFSILVTLIGYFQQPEILFTRSLIAAYFLSFTSLRFIYENHNTRDTLKGIQKSMFDKVVRSKNMKKMIVISNALKKIIIEETQLDENKIAVFHDGATVNKCSYDEAINFIKGKDKFHVGYIGTIGKGRGLELIHNCANSCTEMEFHIIGGTEHQAKSYLKVDKLPVNFHCYGFVAPALTAAYRNECHVMVAPYQSNLELRSGKNSSSYMSPLKIFEYMSSQKAIIASDMPVLREVLNEQNSILCQPDNVSEWINALGVLQENETQRTQIAQQAFDDFENHYSWQKRAQGILKSIKN